jgi:hypothetical protein
MMRLVVCHFQFSSLHLFDSSWLAAERVQGNWEEGQDGYGRRKGLQVGGERNPFQ